MTLAAILARLRSPNAARVYVGKDFTLADLIAALERMEAAK